MKKSVLLTLAIVSIWQFSQAQQGLENVIVERYYKSDANDTNVNAVGGVLPVGSNTYRIYIDMLPDYILQSIYGDPNHEMRIETSTMFFNNEDRGSVHPTFSFNYCDDNTVMLDSWLSVGAACAGHFGILKDQDDSVGTIVNNDTVLLNSDPACGIPLTQQDGLIAGSPEPVITVGINTEIMVFDAQTTGSVFSTYNGGWASLNGSTGPDPALNQVLIAQITTDGVLSFCLNIQIRNQLTQQVEIYVPDSATGNEIVFPGLCWNSTLTDVQNPTIPSAPEFVVYPNPAGDHTALMITAPNQAKKASYILYDLLGHKISEKDLGMISGRSRHEIDLSGISRGIYFMELNVGGVRSSKKIVRN